MFATTIYDPLQRKQHASIERSHGSFGSPAFGTITSAGNPRDFEFAGKLKF